VTALLIAAPFVAAALFVTGVAIASTRISRKGDRS
jgi:hypothetical protein